MVGNDSKMAGVIAILPLQHLKYGGPLEKLGSGMTGRLPKKSKFSVKIVAVTSFRFVAGNDWLIR